MLRYWTAGESHGPALLALVDGFPAGLTVDAAQIDAELVRRQGGYGRGGRQRIGFGSHIVTGWGRAAGAVRLSGPSDHEAAGEGHGGWTARSD
jgi:hypothetical protein